MSLDSVSPASDGRKQSATDLLERIRRQFDFAPYPWHPLEKSPKDNPNLLFIHNLITPFYRRDRRVLVPSNRLILDAGCGTGYKALMLAEANPGAQIIGIDLSGASIEIAQQRLQQHGFPTVELQVLAIEDVASLGLMFDYINCDEVLYLLPDPLAGLQALKSVLSPHGILRANLHSAYQRRFCYQAQALFEMLGLMADTPGEFEVGIVLETMQSLRPDVILKAKTWHPLYEQRPAATLVDHLLLGDKGYTIPDLLALLQAADLPLISLVNWAHWQLQSLFQTESALPEWLQQRLDALPTELHLHLYELLNPIHLSIDFWCGYPTDQPTLPVAHWPLENWYGSTVHLHPQLRTVSIRDALLESCATGTPFSFSTHLPYSASKPISVGSLQAACLLPLWEGSQAFNVLVNHYQQFNPVQFPSQQPMTADVAASHVVTLLTQLENCLYVLVEPIAL